LIRQLLAESLLLSTAGGLLGLVMAQWCADALLVLTRGPASASLDSPAVQTPIVGFTLVLILVAAMLCGIMPALRLTRADQASGMSTSLRTRTGDRAPRVRQSLIVVQVALSIVLLNPAGLLIRTINQLTRVDLGYDPSRILVMSIYPTLAGYEGAREMRLYAELMNRLNALPGIDVASFSRFSLLRRARWHGLTIHADREIIDPNVSFVVDAASPRFFAALGLRLREGRDFSPGDTAQSPRVVVINEALADRYFAAGQAVGRSIELEGVRREIIGVVGNVRFEPRGARAVPAAYIAYTQAPPDMLGQMDLKIRTTDAPQAMIPAIGAEIQRVAPTLAPAFANTASATIASDSDVEASLAILVTTSGVVALFLAMVGLYGSMTQAVTQRTREIGVRLALGAQPREVTGMILGEVGRLVLLGVAIGVPSAWAGAHLVASFLFGVGPGNAVTTVLCCALVTAICIAAAFVPARRAARVDPLLALQHE
jgi:predicted permease